MHSSATVQERISAVSFPLIASLVHAQQSDITLQDFSSGLLYFFP